MLQVKQCLSFIKPIASNPDSPLFIFLPGMDGTGKLYQRQAKRLSKWFDIRCLSIPSHDMSDWDSLTYQLITLIENELRVKHKSLTQASVYLCGESFGGCLALKTAVQVPKLLTQLILVNPASSFNQRPWLSWGIPLTQLMPDWLHRTSSLGLLPFLAALGRIETSECRALRQAMQSLPSDVVSWRLSLLQQFSLATSDFNCLTMPVLLIASGSDRLLPSIQESQKLAQYLGHTKMITLPHSGHACLLEKDIKLDQILSNINLSTETSVI